MRMTGEQRVAAPRQRVWEALNDPDVLRQCIPGCQSLDKDGADSFAAVAEVKIGPIGARFKGAVTLSEIDAPNGYTITGQGSGGIAGSAKGGAKVRLSDDGAGTLVSYEVDAEVGGRMAQLGGPIVDATAKQLAGKFFSKFCDVVSGAEAAANAAPAPAEAPASGAAAPVAAPVAAPAPVATPVAASAPVQGIGLWAWIVTVALGIIAGFFAGRSLLPDSWALVMVLLVAVVAMVAHDLGRRSGDGA